MDYLRTYAEELGLAQLLGAFTEREDVQGAILTLDEGWFAAWRLAETGRLHEWERRWREWRHFMPGPMPFWCGIGDPMGQEGESWIPTRRPDLSWRPRFWDEYTHFSGRGGGDLPPVRLIICLRPPEEDREKFRGIELQETRLPISFEVRPLAFLANLHRTAARPLVGGVSIGAGARTFGTLGGVVQDSSGERFGATCAHVFPTSVAVDQPAQHDDKRAKRVGTSDPVALQHCTSPTPCNRTRTTLISPTWTRRLSRSSEALRPILKCSRSGHSQASSRRRRCRPDNSSSSQDGHRATALRRLAGSRSSTACTWTGRRTAFAISSKSGGKTPRVRCSDQSLALVIPARGS